MSDVRDDLLAAEHWRDRAESALKALRAVEWCDGGFCPRCGRVKRDGETREPDCEIGKALKGESK